MRAGELALTFAAVLACAAVASCEPRLSVRCFAVYYGTKDLDRLELFDLVIVSPLLEEGAVRRLRDKGVIVVGYLSLTTVGGWEPWRGLVEEDMVVGAYEEWGELVVNASDERWQRVILDVALPYVLGKGFSGVFLDNLDMVDAYPFMRGGVVELVRKIRQEHPDIVIVVNRGFSVLSDIAQYIDALLFECFGTTYDFRSKRYVKLSGEDLKWLISTSEAVKELSQRHGFAVLALGYANVSDARQLREYMSFVNSLAKRFGFIPYVSDLHLTWVNAEYAEMAREDPAPRTRLPLALAALLAAACSLWLALRRARSK